jgi:uncharacterized protein YdeI (YjbR/CyaY-like superfamily)
MVRGLSRPVCRIGDALARMTERPRRDQVTVFPDAAAFRTWLERHHADTPFLFVGSYRKSAGKRAMTYPEAVEEALCFGWIDGITYRVDEELYAVRYSPRRKGSNWSATNIARVGQLTAAGRMHPAGLKVFEERDRRRDLPHMHDHPLRQQLPAEMEARLRANPAAWAHWQGLRPTYRGAAAFWIQSAKQEATRERRLTSLIEEGAAGRLPKALRPISSEDR